MDRRKFLGAGISTALCASPIGRALSKSPEPAVNESGVAPMTLGLLIAPERGAAETPISRVKELGLSTCFLSLDDFIGEFTTKLAEDLRGLLHKYEVTPTAAEVVGPGRFGPAGMWQSRNGGGDVVCEEHHGASRCLGRHLSRQACAGEDALRRGQCWFGESGHRLETDLPLLSCVPANCGMLGTRCNTDTDSAILSC